ncbi:pentapeptide repeat-containing protein [Fibrobacter sp. UWH4]|uniref:pentapeptide repeat-containing protein n=1 Tax=Fibrobacter sp. UWH4 TaxID=1896210 RepID=UPI00091C3FE4|nr:pentapeptide repeat-containing protein [Fibrobacter sp. UWH4]SHL06008.1 Pentapeptide repeat-containing protein [Fibrobacter sp. UWH4]
MTQEELDKIIELHQHWLKNDCEGWENMKANLRGANLYGADLSGANLSEANLSDANLYEANLSDANLSGANLRGANLYGADLSGANLSEANLSGANLYGADLSGANLSEANLSDANLYEANLSDANLSGADRFRLGKVVDGTLTGYKKTKEGVVITAEIPAGAIVFCINGSKCRTNRAKITDMAGHDVLHSQYDNSFEYRLGQEINIKDFNLMYNVECASGFHFFKMRKEAEEYR